MDKKRLQELLDAEVDQWSRRSFTELIDALADVVAYGRGERSDFHQFEVQMVEHEADYVHVLVSIDDGGLIRSMKPLTSGFIVRRDGTVER